MDARNTSFDQLSPRFRGFDAYFQAEIAPHAPELAPGAAETKRMSWGLRALIAAAAVYLATAPLALILFPDETAAFRPWAIVSYFIVLPGMLFGLLAPRDADESLTVAAEAWGQARARIAGFFGLEHAQPLQQAALNQFLAVCPAPADASRFVAHERIVGRIRHGAAEGVSLDLIEGELEGKAVAVCALRFPGAAAGIGALLDDRIDGLDRRGLDSLRLEAPSAPKIVAYADSPKVAERITAPETLATLAEMRETTAANAVNLAIVEDTARLYFALSTPVFSADDDAPDAMAVSHALHDYDAIVRIAEALRPLFSGR